MAALAIPPEALESFERLLATPLVEAEQLAERLRSHAVMVERLALTNTNINLPLAHALTERCTFLVGKLAELTEYDQRLVQAAVRYFVLTDDGDDDFDSPSGLDDDAAVVDAVLEHLGLGEHKIWPLT